MAYAAHESISAIINVGAGEAALECFCELEVFGRAGCSAAIQRRWTGIIANDTPFGARDRADAVHPVAFRDDRCRSECCICQSLVSQVICAISGTKDARSHLLQFSDVVPGLADYVGGSHTPHTPDM